MSRKILSIQELKDICLPAFREAFGENLTAAFVHGNSLTTDFSPQKEPWLVSFVLKDNSPQALSALQPYLKNAEKIGVSFGYFFTEQDIKTSEDTFPLEYLHIANQHELLDGSFSLTHFIPQKQALRLECERELRGLLVHLHREFIYMHRKKTPLDFFLYAEHELFPILYGVYFLLLGEYPQSKNQVLEAFPKLRLDAPTRDPEEMIRRTNNYILAITEIIGHIDTLEVP